MNSSDDIAETGGLPFVEDVTIVFHSRSYLLILTNVLIKFQIILLHVQSGFISTSNNYERSWCYKWILAQTESLVSFEFALDQYEVARIYFVDEQNKSFVPDGHPQPSPERLFRILAAEFSRRIKRLASLIITLDFEASLDLPVLRLKLVRDSYRICLVAQGLKFYKISSGIVKLVFVMQRIVDESNCLY